MEFEVCVSNYSTNNKSQALNLEKVGRLTVEQPTKLNLDQNVWTIVTAPSSLVVSLDYFKAGLLQLVNF